MTLWNSWIVLALLTATAFGEQHRIAEDDEAYLGVPLGAIHYTAGGMTGEVYAADQQTLIFARFTHRPPRLGCTSVVVGPARPDDKERVDGDAVPVALFQPVQERTGRYKRFSSMSTNAFYGWPMELDHLTMDPDDVGEDERTRHREKNPFFGIDLAVEDSPRPSVRQIHMETSTPVEFSYTGSIEALVPQQIQPVSRRPKKRKLHKTSKTTTTTTRPEMFNEPLLREFDVEPNDNFPVPIAPLNDHLPTPSMQLNDHLPTPSIPIVYLKKPQSSSLAQEEKEAAQEIGEEERQFEDDTVDEQQVVAVDVQKQLTETFFQVAQSSTSTTTTESTPVGVEQEVEQPGTTLIPTVDDHQDEPVFAVLLGHAPDTPRRPVEATTIQPLPIDSEQSTTTEQLELPDSTTPSSPPTLIPSTTPLFYVVEDPRAARRKARLQYLQRQQNSTASTSPPSTQSTTSTPSPIPETAKGYALPPIENQMVTFRLSNGAKLTDYKWIGLYDHCSKERVSLLSMDNIDPPHREQINPITGWAHNVTSYRVEMLNCNTLLIPGFIYTGSKQAPVTFIHVGVGQFPDAIENQLRAIVVGQAQNEPLRDYAREDVLVILPEPYRTFDIDFLSETGTSFGHVMIPSRLVPPCFKKNTAF